jgi:predicted DNA binding protein
VSFIDDHDLAGEYAIGVSERFDMAATYTTKELAELLKEQSSYIEKDFKKMTLDIVKKVLKDEEITDKQKSVLVKAYVYNFDIDRDNYLY